VDHIYEVINVTDRTGRSRSGHGPYAAAERDRY
jgi:hypothetical protein